MVESPSKLGWQWISSCGFVENFWTGRTIWTLLQLAESSCSASQPHRAPVLALCLSSSSLCPTKTHAHDVSCGKSVDSSSSLPQLPKPTVCGPDLFTSGYQARALSVTGTACAQLMDWVPRDRRGFLQWVLLPPAYGQTRSGLCSCKSRPRDWGLEKVLWFPHCEQVSPC